MSRKIIKSKHFFEEGFIESIAEVSEEKWKDLAPNKELKYIGKPLSRKDGFEKVSGSAIYTTDIKLPRMATARILRSPVPNAKVKRIDTSDAEKIEGVLKIITHQNTPNIKWYGDTSLLFDPHVRYQGDEVACIAAESEQAALDAMKKIKVEYEELPFVTNAGEAMDEGSPKIHDGGNVIWGGPNKYSRGNIDEGFKNADEVIEDEFSTQVVVHNPTEVHCSVAEWKGDKLTVYDSTQAIFTVRDKVAESLDIPAGNVRVIKKYMGGGFGSKLEAGKYSVMAALLSKEIGRPVKILNDRKEMNLAMGNRPDSFQRLKVGVKKNGTITALDHYSYGAGGAYPSGAGCSWPLRTMYKCPNVNVEEYSVYINAGRGRPFRAPGHVQGFFGLESLLDEAAEKIGMDPLEFRLKNYAEVDQVSGNPYTSKKLKEAYQKGAELIGWENRSKPAGSGDKEIKRGIGMSSQIWWGGGGPPTYATLKLNRDGSMNVLCGTQDIGTGTYTFMAQVVAEVMETPMEKIDVSLGDTEDHPYGPSSGGSQTAPSVSPAVRDAAELMKGKLISGAAAILESNEDDLEYSRGKIKQKSSGKELSINDIMDEMREEVLITTGSRSANPDNYAINSFGAQFADVEVDTLTGKVKVKKIVASHDIGRVLNRKTLENQFHGGVMQGLGYALMEDRILDDNTGKVLTTNLYAYKMPTIMDTPEIKVEIVSEADPMISNLGVKGIGEPAIIPTAAAIANAVYNAIGVRVKSLPLTPNKVLMAIENSKKKMS